MGRVAIVTGGAGFLGSHLIDRLLLGFDFVLCIDNLKTGKLSNLAHLSDRKDFAFLNLDIKELNLECLSRICPNKPNVIFNLACPASPPFYQKDPIDTLMTSVKGTYNVLDVASKLGAVVVHASTSEIYGDPTISPQHESYNGNVNTLGPRSCYDEGKRAAETLCRDFKFFKDVDTRVVRIFNTYGPRMRHDDGRVVTNFIMQALNNDDITVYGDGKQTRSFCYVDDLIDAIYRASMFSFDGAINIGNPGEFTMLELADKVIKKTNSKSKIIYCDLPKDDPTNRKPDITKASNILQWTPKISLDKGLDLVIEHFKKETL